MGRQRFFLMTVCAAMLCGACSKTQNGQSGPRATVTMRDGTLVGGTVVATSPNEIKVLGDDNVTRALPMAQVKSIDYQEPASPVPASGTTDQAVPNSAAPDKSASATAPANAQDQTPEPAAQSPTTETHEHPAEAAITTKTFELPVGTRVSVRTEETIDSGKAVEGQTFAAGVTQSVRDAAGATVIPRGANAQIIITSASKGDRFAKASDLGLDLKSVSVEGRRYRVSTVDLTQRGKEGLGANKRTAQYSGGGAALGAIIGAIAGGGKGAAIGAGAGAGAGAVTQVVTKGGSIKVPAETILTFQLDKPLRIVAER
jgi:hypothetical protein